MTGITLESIRRIRDLSPELNRVTDEANALVARVEKFLSEECSVGIPMHVAYQNEPLSVPGRGAESKRQDRTSSLCYERIDGKFRIGIRHRTTQEDYDDEIGEAFGRTLHEKLIAWTSCPREEKLSAFDRLPMLISSIAARMEYISQSARQTSATVISVMRALNGT